MITQVLDTAIAADTMGGLLDWRVRRSPDLPFARCGEQSVTYREIDELADRVQRAFAAQGLAGGERVAMLAHNSIWHLAVMFACARAGVVWCPLNVSLGSDDLAYSLGDVAADLVIVDAALRDALDAARRDALDAAVAPVVVIGDEAAECSIERWTAAAAGAEPLRAEVHAGDAFCVMYSGGTTGRPKGVVLPHFAAVSCGYRLGQVADWERDEVFYSTSHLFHAYLPCAIVPFCMANGFLVCFDDWFSASRFFDRVRECAATIIDPFIGMAAALLAQPERADDRSHTVRLAVSGFGGADPNAIAIRRRFEQRFGVPTYQPYGQTEAGGFIAVETTSQPQRFGSSGRLTGWYDAIIVDEDGMPTGPGSEGELWVRPRFPHVMAHGYLNRAEDTLQNWRNLWVHTGDRCSFDTDGYLWFVGRGGHFLRRRGELVSIGEVEMVLTEHPDVREVAVVAVPSAMGEDDARCSVVVEPGSSLTEAELVEWALERLAPFKVPRFVELVAELPRTATKAEIDRPALARAGTDGLFDREALMSEFDLLLCAVGDTLINHADPMAGFAPSVPILREADIVFANCEGIYVREPSPMLLAADASNAEGLTVGNVSVMSIANNHVMDAGPAGLAATVDVLAELGIQTVGAGRDLDEARRPVVVERRGRRVAFVAAVSTFPAGIEAKRGRAGINPLRFHNHYYLAEGDLEFNPGVMPEVLVIPWPQDIEAMQAAIDSARADADLVVFSVHWGEPVRPVTVQDFERDVSRQLAVEAGADVVLCHHHHIVRGVALHGGAPIFHGLGNFVFHTQGFGAIPPNVKRILEKQGGEYAPAFYEDYPLFPMHPESRITFIAVCGVRDRSVARVGAIPAIVRPDGSVEPLHLDSEEGRSVGDYLVRSNAAANLGTTMRVEGGIEIGGFRALDIVEDRDATGTGAGSGS